MVFLATRQVFVCTIGIVHFERGRRLDSGSGAQHRRDHHGDRCGEDGAGANLVLTGLHREFLQMGLVWGDGGYVNSVDAKLVDWAGERSRASVAPGCPGTQSASIKSSAAEYSPSADLVGGTTPASALDPQYARPGAPTRLVGRHPAVGRRRALGSDHLYPVLLNHPV